MLFCNGCGSLKRRHADGTRECPKCANSGAPPAPEPLVRTIKPDLNAPRPHPYFPFTTARKGQLEFLSEVEACIDQGKVMVAQVPTGLGKTAAVLAPAIKAAVERGQRVFYLTPKQSQHKNVVETLRAISAVIGKKLIVSDMISKQAMCPRPESEQLNGIAFSDFCANVTKKQTCSYVKQDSADVVQELKYTIHHVEEAVRSCVAGGVCPYKALVETGRQAHVVVLDYNHFFSDMLEGTLDRFGLDLKDAVLIIDEAHNLPDRVRDHLSWRLSPNALVDAGREARSKGGSQLSKCLQALAMGVDKLAIEERGVKPMELEALLEDASRQAWPLGAPDRYEIIDAIREVAERVEKEDSSAASSDVADFLDRFPPKPGSDERSLLRATHPESHSILYRSLDAADLARPILHQARAAIIMSGTLYPMEMYAQILGVEPDRLVTRLYENPFPSENRRVVIDQGVSTAYRDRSPATFKAIADRISGIAGETTGNVAAFFPSYEILDQVRERLRTFDRRIVTEARGMVKDERERLVGELRRAAGRGLLLGVLGGSLSEGYDFVEGDQNLIRSIVVVGVPYERPSLESKALELFFNQTFGPSKGRVYGYVAPAGRRMLQAAGRGIRAPHHKCFIALLDHRYSKSPLSRIFPPDFKYDLTRDVVADCRAFFQGGSRPPTPSAPAAPRRFRGY